MKKHFGCFISICVCCVVIEGCFQITKTDEKISLSILTIDDKEWKGANDTIKEVSIIPVINCKFSKPINLLSLEEGMTLYGKETYPILLTMRVDKTSTEIMFNVQLPLQYETLYVINLTTEIISQTGSALYPSATVLFRTIAANDDATITSFSFLKADNPGLSMDCQGALRLDTFWVDVPFETNLRELRPTIVTASEQASVHQRSKTPGDFSFPISYEVTAQSGAKKKYTVAVKHLANTENFITRFSFLRKDNGSILTGDYDGFIDGNTIYVFLPYGTNVSSLIPTLRISTNASVNPQSGQATGFSFFSPTPYVVTSESKTENIYNVFIKSDQSDEKDITRFAFVSRRNPSLPANSAYQGTFGGTGNTVITVNMPWVSPDIIKSLFPSMSVSAGATITPDTLDAQNFNSPIIYRISSQLGNSKNYTVVVIN